MMRSPAAEKANAHPSQHHRPCQHRQRHSQGDQKAQHDGAEHGIDQKPAPDRGQNHEKDPGLRPGPARRGSPPLVARGRRPLGDRKRACDRPGPVRTRGRARDRGRWARISEPLPGASNWSPVPGRKNRRILDGWIAAWNFCINPSGTSADPHPRAGSRQRVPSCPSPHKADWVR